MASATFTQIAQDAFGILGAYAPNETIDATDMQTARRFANDLLSEWGQRDLFIPVLARERFDQIANRGGPYNPYTIGPGGDLNTERPSNQESIVAANMILTTTSPEVRVPLAIYTDMGYFANQIPGMSNTQETGLYYNPTYDNDLGSLYLWPVPNSAVYDLELLLQKGIPSFANTTTTYFFPDGFLRALKYNLADALQTIMGKELPPAALRIATASLSTFKRANHRLKDQATDALFGIASQRGVYNILTNGA